MRRVRLSISRRAIMVTLATLAFAPEVALAQEFELKVSHFLPPNHTFQKELLRWGDELEKASGGRLKLKLYPAAQLGPPEAGTGIQAVIVVLLLALTAALVAGGYLLMRPGGNSTPTTRGGLPLLKIHWQPKDQKTLASEAVQESSPRHRSNQCLIKT